MRLYPVLFCLLAALSLTAQTTEKTANRWEISASFAPDLNPKVGLSGVRFEANPNDSPVSQRFGFDTITINSQDRIFSRLSRGSLTTKPQERNFWFGASVNIHRRIGESFDFSAGLQYSQASYTNQLTDMRTQNSVVNTSRPFLYNLEAYEVNTSGATVRINYHLFPTKRFHPYAGFGISSFVVSTERTFLGRIYSGDDTFLPLAASPETIQNTTLDLNFMVTGGLLYRVSDQWSAGVNATSRLVNGPGLFGLELRRTI